jgi:hypothetical protein
LIRLEWKDFVIELRQQGSGAKNEPSLRQGHPALKAGRRIFPKCLAAGSSGEHKITSRLTFVRL